MKKWKTLLLAGGTLLLMSACQSYQDGINVQTTANVPKTTVLAKIKPNMTKPEVVSILGEPNYYNDETDSLLYVPIVGAVTGAILPLMHEYYYYNREGVVKFDRSLFASQSAVGAVKYDPNINFKNTTIKKGG